MVQKRGSMQMYSDIQQVDNQLSCVRTMKGTLNGVSLLQEWKAKWLLWTSFGEQPDFYLGYNTGKRNYIDLRTLKEKDCTIVRMYLQGTDLAMLIQQLF